LTVRAQHRVGLLFAEHREAAQQRQAGIDQRGELAGEDHQGLAA
jgi:hypothetical protein